MVSTTSVLRLIVLFVFHNPIATADTLITFPNFSPHDDFYTLGDVAYDPDHRSYIINAGARTLASRGSCGLLVYGKKVRIQNVETGRVASFSLSFTFTFVMTQYVTMASLHDTFYHNSQFGACKILQNQNIRVTPPKFAVEFDTDYNPSRDKEPSNNFIRVGRNLDYEYDVEAYTHNLCGNDTHCSYFSNGRIFTAWIDFSSSSQTLEFRMTKGSNFLKPVQPLFLISNYKFPRWIGDEVLISFWAASDVNHLEEHELLSWSFFSTGISESKRESKFQLMLQYLKSKTWVGVTSGVLFGTLAALLILWSVFTFASPSTSYTTLGYSTGPRGFSYNELCKATDNFVERIVLGRGGSGVVYKGSLEGESRFFSNEIF